MKNIFVAAAALSGLCTALVPTQSYALDVTLLGRLGYDSIQGEKAEGADSEPKAITGYDLGVLGQVSIVDLSLVSLYGGAGLSYVSLSNSDDGTDNSASLLVLPLELGVSFKAIPILTLQGAVGYDVGLSGTGKVKTDGVTTNFDITSHGGVTLTARAMMSFIPLFMGGLELQYMPTGSQEIKPDGGEKVKGDISAFAVRLVAGVGI